MGILWKEDNLILLDNYEMVLRRLINIERCLLKSFEWYLFYFFVVWLDRVLIKICIVFDVIVRYEEVFLNDVIY